MRILSSLLLGAALVGSSVPAVAAPRDNGRGEAKLAKLLAGRVPGRPVSCISQFANASSQVVDGTAIVYRVAGRLYVNRPRIGAESLDDDNILVSKTHGGQLCRLDTIRLIDRGSRIERSFVTLGDFVPYSRPRR